MFNSYCLLGIKLTFECRLNKLLMYSQGIYLMKWQIFGSDISDVSAYINDCESLEQAIFQWFWEWACISISNRSYKRTRSGAWSNRFPDWCNKDLTPQNWHAYNNSLGLTCLPLWQFNGCQRDRMHYFQCTLFSNRISTAGRVKISHYASKHSNNNVSHTPIQ